MTGSRVDRRMVGQAGQPQKIPIFCKEGVGVSIFVEERERGGGGWQTYVEG